MKVRRSNRRGLKEWKAAKQRRTNPQKIMQRTRQEAKNDDPFHAPHYLSIFALIVFLIKGHGFFPVILSRIKCCLLISLKGNPY
jgi:hypothetical protein